MNQMRQMQEAVAGSGTLSDEIGATRAVHFHFEIMWELIPGPGGQSALGNPRSRGGRGVSADDGQPISEGIYRLVDSDGKHLRVQKLGMQWHLLSPRAG
jgi:hypothetical protein